MAILNNPEERFWRTDAKLGRNIYALISNDITKPSENDPLVGSMETPTLAEDVVDTHNSVLSMYGKPYLKRLTRL